MQILPFSNNANINQVKSPQFKSAYPVYHWVAEKAGGHYAPAVSLDLNKTLQGKLIRLFNGSTKFSETQLGKKMMEKLAVTDFAYRFNQVVRSYYNHNGGWKGKFQPISYLITGNDVAKFDEKFGKPIGRSFAESPKIKGRAISAEHNNAVNDYKFNGMHFVTDSKKRIMCSDGLEYGLHTKFEVVRDKNGKIKSYDLVDIKFCPESGENNPFVRLGYYQG